MSVPADFEIDPRIPDDELTDDELAARRASRNADHANRRIDNRALREAVARAEEAEAKVAQFERREALTTAQSELKAQGPLGAFLRTYEGEPTPEAIREAISKDPDFRDLVIFEPDPVQVALAEQTANAAKLAGGTAPSLGQLAPKDIHAWPMDRKEQFRKEHPALWQRALTAPDEPIAAPAGWA